MCETSAWLRPVSGTAAPLALTAVAGRLRLADLLGGLSLVADLGFGLPPGTAVRSCVIAASLARRMDLDDEDVRDCFYIALLMHVGCVGVAHESAAAFGDDIALNRAVSSTNLADPEDIAATLLPELTRGMPPDGRPGDARDFALTEGQDWGRRTDIGVCEVARDTARRLGLPARPSRRSTTCSRAGSAGGRQVGCGATTSRSPRGWPGPPATPRCSASSVGSSRRDGPPRREPG